MVSIGFPFFAGAVEVAGYTKRLSVLTYRKILYNTYHLDTKNLYRRGSVITFDQLEIFEKIVEHGSFQAAAKALHRTQPTLSVAIKNLEVEFDLMLFSREGYRPTLTDAGRVFYGWAQQTLQSFRNLGAIGKELGLHEAEPRLSVVIDPVARLDSIQAIFSECLNDMKATELTLRYEIVREGMELVRSGEVDFAITPKVDDADDLETFAFEKVEMVAVMATARMSDMGKVTANWLRGQPQVIVSTGIDTSDLTKQRGLGVLNSGKRCFVTDHTLKRRLIEGGFGWGRLARHEIQDQLKAKHLTVIPSALAKGFTLELHVMRSKNRPMGPVARAVWARLKALEDV